MFRVPASADAPTFDETFKVSFGRWFMTSFSKAGSRERHEWARRRIVAHKAQLPDRLARAEAWGERNKPGIVRRAEARDAARAARRAERKAARRAR